MGALKMSVRERRRLELLSRVQEGVVTLVKASELAGISYRQMKRLWRRYREQGDRGLVHRSRGRVSNRGYDQEKKAAVSSACSKHRRVDPLLVFEGYFHGRLRRGAGGDSGATGQWAFDNQYRAAQGSLEGRLRNLAAARSE